MRVTFCGVRGSTPAPGPDFVRYGGHTSCVAVAPDGGRPTLLLDGGTGLMRVTELLGATPFDGTLLLGHLHWDHTHGIPFFRSGTAHGSRVDVLLPEQVAGRPGDAHATLARCFSPPHFPVEPRELGGGWTFAEIAEGARTVEGFEVLAREIPHKGGRTFGYRVSDAGGSLAYLSDHSPTGLGPGPDGLGERHEAALALASGADLLITDAQHLAAQFPDVAFLGHASVEYDVELAVEAGARTLVLFHHDPWRTDDEVDAVLALARDRAAGRVEVVAAREGLEVGLGG
ncbi:MBL fold metallo-hydrolase [Nocardioides marinus]|uniref:Phosphoribosyl 1,2-cyclic phosphodiesterase n=1 Tax=Nocardioides marinus TaxID=374514 RepID=A0A7Y9YH95_9ACTN|nr:MBL fold metallo-hydrolase [Nocardioides marinus]NYI10415.1 phosphoribosyl 1,2-cyclic phosphodiesterase [Nocardioides marinus]